MALIKSKFYPLIFFCMSLLLFWSDLQAGWKPPINLSQPNQNRNAPYVAENAAGYAVAVWYGANDTIQAATRSRGGSWSLPVNVSTAQPNVYAPFVLAAIDETGNVVAAWQGGNENTQIVQAATLPFGGNWSTPITLSPERHSSIESVVMNAEGYAVAIWSAKTLQSSTLSFGGQWSKPVSLPGTGNNLSNAQIAIDGTGNVVAVWENDNNGTIQAATLPFKKNWSNPVTLSPTGKSALFPYVSMNTTGYAVAIWRLFEGVIQSSTLMFGESWSNAVDIPNIIPPNNTSPNQFQIVVDEASNAVATWVINLSTPFVQTATLPYHGEWSTPIILSGEGKAANSFFIASNPSGNAILTWNEASNFIQTSSLTFGDEWSDPINLSSTEVNATLPDIAIDGAGNAVAIWQGAKQQNLTVQAASQTDHSWQSATNISGENVREPITSPFIATDGAGYAVAVWSHSNFIQAATLSRGGSWSAPVILTKGSPDEPPDEPTVTMNASGYAVAVWRNSHSIQAATLSRGGNWSAPVDISSSPSTINPLVAIDATGNAVAVWTAQKIQAATLPFGGSWSAPVDLSPIRNQLFATQVAMNASGYAIAIWFNNAQNAPIQAATLQFGSSWSAPANLSASEYVIYPSVAVNDSGNAIAIWENLTSNAFQSSTLSFNGNWSAPVDLPVTTSFNNSPEIAMDGTGNAVAVWSTDNTTSNVVQAATLPFNGSWSLPVNLSAPSPTLISPPQIAANAAGNFAVVWGLSSCSIQASKSFSGNYWSTPTTISTLSNATSAPIAAMDSFGDAVVVYQGNNNTNYFAQAVEGIKLFPTLPPRQARGKQVKNKFATQTDLINVLTWQASPSHPVSYKIYRNAALNDLAGIVPASSLQFKDHNRRKNVTSTYYIVAVNAQGGISSPVVVVVPPS